LETVQDRHMVARDHQHEAYSLLPLSTTLRA